MIVIYSYLIYFLCLLYVVLVTYFMIGWFRLEHQPNIHVSGSLKVSILIAARNEEDTILPCLHDILDQNYPPHLLEVIVVDDHSTDQTAERVRSLHEPRVNLIILNEKKALNSYKKRAISEAIGRSSGDLIITTDADCRMGPLWLATIIARYEKGGARLISSPVTYFEEKNVFEKLQTYEFMYLISMGASAIGNKIPFTCNGANLAYEKKMFIELGGFNGIDHIASGDDELFLHKVASAYPGEIAFLKAPEAIVYTYAKPTFYDFMQQRKRWASKSVKYKNKVPIILLAVLVFFNASIVLNVLGGILIPALLKLAIVAFLCKFFIDAVSLYLCSSFFRRRELMIYVLPMVFFHLFYLLYIYILGNTGKYEWKDRMVN